MFSLLYGLWEYVFRKEELHLLILGLDKAGKTTLLERLKTLHGPYAGLEPGSILPTVGLNVGRLEAHQAQLILWDLGGAPGLRGIWDKYFADSHALLFVVDAADTGRLEEAKAALERCLGSHDLYGAPLLVLANKADRPGAAGAEAVQAALGLGLLDSRPVRVARACALSGEGLPEALTWLVEQTKRSARASLLRKRSLRT